MEKRIYKSKAASWAALLVLTAGAFTFCLWRCGIYPFGPNTALLVDLGQQYTDFLLFFRNSSILEKFYSFSKGFGGQTMGLTAYYLFSPFNFLTYLFPSEKIEAAVIAILYAKFLWTACCANWYFSRHYARFTVPFALFYALSPYVMMYYFNILWLDGFALLPLLVFGCEQVLENGKTRFFTIAYFCALLANYYIAYMSSLFILLYFFFYGCARLALPARQLLDRIGRMARSVALAVCLAAPVLLPTLLQLKSGKLSGESSGLLGLTQGSRMFNPLLIFANIFTGSFMYETVPFVFFTAGTLLLLLAFFASRGCSVRHRLGAAALWGFLLLSLWLHPLYYIWHAFQEPEGFYYRFYFVYWFFLLTLCRQGMEGLPQLNRKAFWGGAAAALVGCFGFYAFTRNTLPWGTHTVWLTLGFVLALAGGIAAACRGKKHAKTLLASVLVISLLADSVCVFCRAYSTSPTANTAPDYAQNYTEKQALLASTAEGFYRVEDLHQRPGNQPMGLGYFGTTHFSSTYDDAQKQMYLHFGYPDTFLSTTYTHSELLTDSLWGIRYLMAQQGDSVDTAYTVVAQQGDSMLYENPYALPLLFAMDSGEIPYAADGNAHLNALYRSLNGGRDVYDSTAQTIDRSALAAAATAAQSGAAHILHQDGGLLTAELTVSDGEMLATTIPYDTSWYATVDGKAAETAPFLTYFLSVPLSAGTHIVRLIYIPAGLPAGCALCAGALAVLLCLYLLRRRKARIH